MKRRDRLHAVKGMETRLGGIIIVGLTKSLEGWRKYVNDYETFAVIVYHSWPRNQSYHHRCLSTNPLSSGWCSHKSHTPFPPAFVRRGHKTQMVSVFQSLGAAGTVLYRTAALSTADSDWITTEPVCTSADEAETRISPCCLSAWTIAEHRPLKALRWPSREDAGLSGS